MRLISNHGDWSRRMVAYTMYIEAECSKFLAGLLDMVVNKFQNVRPEQF